jgi:four helix bundle protein
MDSGAETGVGHRQLRVWQEAMVLAEVVYALTRRLPRDEIYGLTSQMNRAAISIPSNIAEGYGRGGRDYERFAAMAYGSVLELETQAELAERLGLAPAEAVAQVTSRTAVVGRMLNALRRGLRRQRTANAADSSG